ncbi:hypothetical protein [Methylocystis sp. S23]
MKRIFAAFLLLPPAFVLAEEKTFDCVRENGLVQCEALQDNVGILGIAINGGECVSPRTGLYRSALKKGAKFMPPGARECYYVRMITIITRDGKAHTFLAL